MSKVKHEEYDQIRQGFYTLLQRRILSQLNIAVDVTSLEPGLLEQAMQWQNRRYPWDWSEIQRKFRSIPSRLELAVSVQGRLCGLMIGKRSRGRRHVSAYFMEGNQGPTNPLKGNVRAIMLEGLATYGYILECQYCRLVEPVEALVPMYEKAGFVLARDKIGRLYCEKSLVRSE